MDTNRAIGGVYDYCPFCDSEDIEPLGKHDYKCNHCDDEWDIESWDSIIDDAKLFAITYLDTHSK
ncbi:unnamed protein product [marine sediment metagenome]|uniref:Transposase zinc-ribbon domain-containing protein n=1 Tax=marine sediment metagenome TaxID=412755 RepID=X1A9Y7_9ZZZZ